MRFIDEVVIHALGGAGGDGCLAFRRESHVPMGGPSGGDGGNGGGVELVADPGLHTLVDQRYQRRYQAGKGQRGQGHDRYGRRGKSLVVRVPCGTVVYDRDTAEMLCDLVAPGQRFTVVQGGQGGRGNIHFVSSVNRTPRQTTAGEPGEDRWLRLELKVLADVGLVGLPSVGKSSLIAKVSAARPKVADYPFTTLAPNLGVVRLSDERSFVLADIPGLIEGAHDGVGLGLQFLRHVERTRVLVIMVDDRHALAEEPGSPAEDLAVLRTELMAHDPELAGRPALVVLNKVDLLPPERTAEVLASLEGGGGAPLGISAVTGEGVRALLEQVWRVLCLQRRGQNADTCPKGTLTGSRKIA